jgi:DNA-binding protein Fis
MLPIEFLLFTSGLFIAGSGAESFDLSGVLDQIEKELIEKVLFQAGGLQAEAARRMGLSRSALAYKLQKYGIRLSPPQSPA